MEFGHVTWRKSSYSASGGGNCVEVGAWTKASYSNANGGNCVEVTRTQDMVVAVRDSTDPDGPRLAFAPADWRSFIGRVKAGTLGPA